MRPGFAQRDGLLDLAPIAGIGPAGVTGIADNEVVGLCRHAAAENTAQLLDGVADFFAGGPVGLARKTKDMICDLDVRARGAYTVNGICIAQGRKIRLGNKFE